MSGKLSPGLGALLAIFCLGATHQLAAAQVATGEERRVVTPVEIVIETIDGEVRCRPPRARLPGSAALELRVANRADQPIFFVAPEFFRAAEVQESSGFTYDVVKGGFLAAPESTVRILLRTPVAGEYYYSCFAPGAIPTPQSSGFLIVVPAANP